MRYLASIFLAFPVSISTVAAQAALSAKEVADLHFPRIEAPLTSLKVGHYIFPISIQFDKYHPEKSGLMGLGCFVSLFDSRLEKISEDRAVWYTPFGGAKNIGTRNLQRDKESGDIIINFDESLKFVYSKGRLSKMIHSEPGGGGQVYTIVASAKGMGYQLLHAGNPVATIAGDPLQRQFAVKANGISWNVAADENPSSVDLSAPPRVASITTGHDGLSLSWEDGLLKTGSLRFPGARRHEFPIRGKAPVYDETHQTYVTAAGTKVEEFYWRVSPGFTKIRKLVMTSPDATVKTYRYFYDADAKLLKMEEE